jgi:hypothetical protein
MRLLAFIGALAIIGAIAAAVFFFGGFFNIAATEQDPSPVAWAITRVREAAISHHATDNPPANLGDPATIRAGARAYSERGCVNSQSIAARSQGRRRRSSAARAILGGEERHQDDRHAEFRVDRCTRSGNLVDRRLPQEAADRLGGRLQELERISLAWNGSPIPAGGSSLPAAPTHRTAARSAVRASAPPRAG